MAVAVVTSPKDNKILLSRHRRVSGHTLLHLSNSNNSFLKDLSLPFEHRLNHFLGLTKAPWTILTPTVLYLVRTMAEVNLALPNLVDNLWEGPW